MKTRRRRPPAERLRVAILSRKERLYSTRRLVEATRAFGHEPVVLDTLRCDLLVEQGKPSIFYEGRALEGISVAIPRIGASITRYGIAVVNQLEAMGIPVVASSGAIARSRDKLRCLQVLASSRIDVPRTVMMREREHLELAVEQLGGLPVIVKLLQGTQGVGVMLAHSLDELESTLDTMWNLEQEILLQEFVAESRGKDVRALVVGDRVVGAMRRVAKVEGEFRSNIHRGGSGEPIELPASWAEEAIRAARACGLDVAGVDLLESSAGPRITEINSSPGIEGLERATGKDIAAEIIAHAVSLARGAERVEGRES
ncbi:Ribosomal protein S6 glutaminyl transferase [Vulgatibacter incomptus]|uniref:Ribosomal protein S6 glutaminyl transferase n=1 Tax=Vulgatibacter incomptus TaxID=1391653 RepID=A0A0K1PH15_9BACT|nr:Ribosomal protein S6 glutaminyl transferase [Vulgatibacter incomptus]